MGIENSAENTGKTHVFPESGAESGALGAWEEAGMPLVTSQDAGLLAIVEAWAGLAESVKASILAMVRGRWVNLNPPLPNPPPTKSKWRHLWR